MGRPRRKVAFVTGALVALVWAASSGSVLAVGASRGSLAPAAPVPGDVSVTGASGRPGLRVLPVAVREALARRSPDAMRAGPHGPVRAGGRGGVRGAVRVAENWSGEVHTGSHLTWVSATWTVPSVVPSASLEYAATWVGIGGLPGTTLIQVGTIAATAARAVGYTAWLELLPTPAWTLTSKAAPGGTAAFVVDQGDVVHASVNRAGANLWHVTIQDVTEKWTYSRTFAYEVGATSADWITERPSFYTAAVHKTVLSTLADYGSTRFDHLMTAEAGDRASAPTTLTPVRMERAGDVISAPGPTSPASSPTGVSFTDSYLTVPSRIYGPTAGATAAAELEHQFTYRTGDCPSSPTSGRAVVLATETSYPDALASAYLASDLRTGTLLTAPTSVPAATLAAIRNEGITRVYVVGGPLAITSTVVSQLESTEAYDCGGTAPLAGTATVQVTRIAGVSEYATAFAVATFSGAVPGSVDLAGAYAGVNGFGGNGAFNVTAGNASASAPPGALTTAILATGKGFQDAEAASVLAYVAHLPILLTTPGHLSGQVLTAVKALRIRQVIAMGGPLALSDADVGTLEAHGVSVLRIAGTDGTQTAIELARCELDAAASHAGLGWDAAGKLSVAGGSAYSDGLAGAVVAADGPASSAPEPLLLTAGPTSLGHYLVPFLESAGTLGLGGKRITGFTVLGGPDALSQAAVNTMVVALLG